MSFIVSIAVHALALTIGYAARVALPGAKPGEALQVALLREPPSSPPAVNAALTRDVQKTRPPVPVTPVKTRAPSARHRFRPVVAAPSHVALPPPLITHEMPAVARAPSTAVRSIGTPAIAAVAPAARALPGTSEGGLAHTAARSRPPSIGAAYLYSPPPAYPLAARRDGDEGTVMLRVLVTRAGMPGRVTVDRSSGTTVLDEAAVAAVKGWRFVPAQRAGRAVDVWVLVPIVFQLRAAS